MDNENFAKFNLSFYLAVLFHLFVLAVFVLAVSLENQAQIEKPFHIMQASIFEEAPSLALADAEAIAAQGAPKRLSKAEKKRLVRAEKQAHRLEQQERKKILAGVAKRMVLTAIQEKQAALEKKSLQPQDNAPSSPLPGTQANALSTPALENPDEQKKNSTAPNLLASERDV
jgi:hypothetical protein